MSALSISSFNATDGTWLVHHAAASIVKAAMRRATFNSIWAGMLLTLVIALVLLSTAQQRRGIIFYIQCLAFPLALVYNALCIVYAYWEQQSIFSMPGDMSLASRLMHLQVVTLSLEHWVPLLSDSALLFKFASFYPGRMYSRLDRAIRLGPLVLLLIPRIALTCAFTYAAADVYFRPLRVAGQQRPVYKTSHVDLLMTTGTAEFALQAPYCLYAAMVLLYKTLDLRRNTVQHRGSGIYSRLRFFTETIFMTFVPPVAFSIACAVQLNCPTTGYCSFREISGTNLNSSVAFSLLATSWSTIRSRRRAQKAINAQEMERGADPSSPTHKTNSGNREPHERCSASTAETIRQQTHCISTTEETRSTGECCSKTSGEDYHSFLPQTSSLAPSSEGKSSSKD